MMALLGARYNHWQQLRRLKIPVVDLAESRPNIKLPRVTMDNKAIGRIAAEHFLESGYRHFAVYHRWELGSTGDAAMPSNPLSTLPVMAVRQYLGRCRKAALPQATMNMALGQSANMALGQFASLYWLALQVNHIRIRNRNNMSKCHVNTEGLAAQSSAIGTQCCRK
jgi:hypothetical protein